MVIKGRKIITFGCGPRDSKLVRDINGLNENIWRADVVNEYIKFEVVVDPGMLILRENRIKHLY